LSQRSRACGHGGGPGDAGGRGGRGGASGAPRGLLPPPPPPRRVSSKWQLRRVLSFDRSSFQLRPLASCAVRRRVMTTPSVGMGIDLFDSARSPGAGTRRAAPSRWHGCFGSPSGRWIAFGSSLPAPGPPTQRHARDEPAAAPQASWAWRPCSVGALLENIGASS
jgi:hypothetical protein